MRLAWGSRVKEEQTSETRTLEITDDKRTKNGQSVHGDEMKQIPKREAKRCFIPVIKITGFQESCQKHQTSHSIGEHTYQMIIR